MYSAFDLPRTLPCLPLTSSAARTRTSVARRTNLRRDVKNGVLGVDPERSAAFQIRDFNDCALAPLRVWAGTVDLVPVVQLYALKGTKWLMVVAEKEEKNGENGKSGEC